MEQESKTTVERVFNRGLTRSTTPSHLGGCGCGGDDDDKRDCASEEYHDVKSKQ